MRPRCKITRRILGIAGVADVRSIHDPHLRLRVEQLALRIGIQLVEHFKSIRSVSDLISLITESYE